VATWAVEHSLRIGADRSEAALFCISPHQRPDEDTADHRLGDRNSHVRSHSVPLLGNAIDRHLNCGSHVTAAAGQTVPRRHRLRLSAGLGVPAHHAFLAGRMHPQRVAPRRRGNRTVSGHNSHLHSLDVRHGDGSTEPLGPRAAATDAFAHLAVSPTPLRRIIGSRALTQHERLTRLLYVEDVRGAIRLEAMPPSMRGRAATTIPLPRDAVLNGP
ncbi:hypothetical protein MOQ_007249, partial [Trypanosoma cruzi marinkellei]